jgi:cell division protein YceG involved in septum cleavage
VTEHVEGPGPGGPAASRPESSRSSDPGAGLTRRERREAREANDKAAKAGRGDGSRAATRAAKKAKPEPAAPAPRPRRADKRAARAATKAPPRPAWVDAPTEETPIVDGGGNGGGTGLARPSSGAARSARRTVAVAVVLGLLTVPLLIAAIIIVGPNLVSSGGTPPATAKPAGGGQVQLLLRPGLTINGIAATVAQLPGHTAAGFLQVANSGLIRSSYEPATTNSLEGLLFPDTYFVLPNESYASILHRLVDRFDQIGDQIGLGGTTAVTPYQTIVVASLIQQEVKVPTDAPLVAAVIYNRLKLGMPLQIDATLCYVKGGCPPVPSNADKQRVSPYNTYKVTGLPPTPIASVTMASLQAAMAPASVPYLYYVISDASGKLAFSTTLAGQNHNIAIAHQKGLL